MIYYPLSTLMLAGIREVLIITNPHELDQFQRLLGDGSQWGMSLTFATQSSPRGLADAFLVGEAFIGEEPVALVLGDNIFHGPGLGGALGRIEIAKGATIFSYMVSDPENYGVLEFDQHGKVAGIQEKPWEPKSSWVIPGLYFYDSTVSRRARELSPSKRGELEITDLNLSYLSEQALSVIQLERGTAWLDTGTFESLQEAGDYVRIVEKRQGSKVGCPEEVAWRNGWIANDELLRISQTFSKSGYGDYLRSLVTGTGPHS